MKDNARVVIIGAGIVGCGVAYYLTQMGWRDVVVLEQGPLFQNWGSTSHAPGLMFQHNNSKMMCRLAKWSVELYTELQALTPDPSPTLGEGSRRMVFQTGSLEIAHTPERWHELKRKQGNALAWGLDAHLVGPDEVKRMVPIMRTDDLYGAFFVPSDCDVKGAALCEAMASIAQQRGATFYAHTPVTNIIVKNGRVQGVAVRPVRYDPQGRQAHDATEHHISCERVVCAAGLWGPVVGRMAGVELPLTPVQHLYAKTAPLKELAGETEEVRHPIVRYQDKDLYFRQHGEAYGIGSYRHDPLLVPADELPRNDHPAIFPFTPEHFEESWDDAVHRFPCFRDTQLTDKFNGLFSFTPDGNSLLGESADVRGFWAAEAVWVTHAGGVGRALAEWMTDGAPSIDLHDADVNRFHRFMFTQEYIRARAERQYIEVYDIIHPLQQMENPRGLRVSPFHARLRELGAHFFESAGWERAQWFEKQLSLTPDPSLPSGAGRTAARRGEWAARYWSPLIAAEHRATRERVGMFDLTAFTKLEVTGAGALAFLQRLAANQMDQPIGRVTYTAMLNEQGGIESDLTVTRLAPDKFWVVTGGGVGMHDLAWLTKHLPDGKTSEATVQRRTSEVYLRDITSQWCCVGVWGPRARELMQRVTRADVSNAAFPYMTARPISIGYVPALAIRISYAGELGWEVYAPTEFGLKLWDTLWDAGQSLGVTAVGGGAFDSLRLEKGYRLWGADIHSEYNPYEAGLGFAVRLNKGAGSSEPVLSLPKDSPCNFIGRDALVRIKAQGITRKLCCLTLDDPRHIVMGKEPILRLGSGHVLDGDGVLGYVTSANFGYTVGKSIAYGYLPLSHAQEGTRVSVYFFGERYAATVTREPLFDPQMARLKS